MHGSLKNVELITNHFDLECSNVWSVTKWTLSRSVLSLTAQILLIYSLIVTSINFKLFSYRIKLQQEQLDHDETLESQQSSEIGQVSEIKFTPSQPGSVRCKARNRLGSDHASGQVKLGDLARPFMISGLKEEQRIADGDSVKLECGAIIYNYSSNIVWRKDGEPIENIGNLLVQETNTKFSWRKTLIWKQISKEDYGIYECEVYSKDSDEIAESLQVAIAVHDTQKPIISSNFNQTVMQQSLGDSLKLDCLVSGLPVPQLLWYKNDVIFSIDEVHSDDNSLQRIMIDSANTSITFSVLRLEDAGTYKCEAWNRVGQDFKSVQLEIPSEFIKSAEMKTFRQ